MTDSSKQSDLTGLALFATMATLVSFSHNRRRNHHKNTDHGHIVLDMVTAPPRQRTSTETNALEERGRLGSDGSDLNSSVHSPLRSKAISVAQMQHDGGIKHSTSNDDIFSMVPAAAPLLSPLVNKISHNTETGDVIIIGIAGMK